MSGGNKLLLPFADSTVLGETVARIKKEIPDLLVVLGSEAERVRRSLPDGVQWVLNPNYSSGLASSIVCGVEHAPTEEGWLIALGDMPLLDLTVLQRLKDMADSACILAPTYSGEPDRLGHPIVFGATFRRDLLNLKGDSGARSILRAHPERIRTFPVEGKLEDIDTVSDYRGAMLQS